MIQLKSVVKSYKDNIVLKNINLHIKKGEFVSIVGPSGCGKSTLIHLIAGLSPLTEGEIFVNGKKVKDPGPDKIMVFQEAALFPWLSVFDNVDFGLKRKIKNPGERKEIVEEMLKRVHLAKYKNHYPHEISGGMKQRVALARSFVMNPDVLLMDEPFSALDEQTRVLLHGELQNMWMDTHKTILFVTHNIREAVTLSDRVIVMGANPGTIIGDVSIDLSYPRNVTEDGLMHMEKQIYKLLEKEIEKRVKEELGGEYQMEKANGPYDYVNTMGGGI